MLFWNLLTPDLLSSHAVHSEPNPNERIESAGEIFLGPRILFNLQFQHSSPKNLWAILIFIISTINSFGSSNAFSLCGGRACAHLAAGK